MSADSPRRGVHKGAQVISPQPIVDRSIIDSVAGIINDIVPQAYAGTPNSDNKESISWARFEYADVNDPTLYPDYNEGSSTPPLLLVLGYTTGVQVWLIAATGEATEVLSWRQGVVRTLRILPNPKTDDEHADLFEPKRPMVAICDSAGPGPQFCNITFISLKTGEQAKSIKFKNPVCDVLANRRSVVVTFLEKIAVFDARTLEDVLTVTTCYASPGPNPNPVALGTRWLAYSEKKLLPAKRSSGGCEGEGVQSYTATVLYAAKSLGKGLRGLGETVASSLTGNSVSPIVVNNTGSDVTQPGVITILDLQAAKEEKELDDANIETVIAHFTAHSDAIVAMTFDLSGALLMTADKRGHDFHVFRIQPHPGGPTLAAVHHLYVLHRGDTTAKVQDMVFSSDTRWAAISTVRGTTHVFPVAPYGGPVGVRTHSTPHVVNRLSRFHRSAGLMDDGTRSHSPVSHTELPLSVFPYSNPRLPPYPHPTVLHPLAQIRQPSTLNHVNSQVQPSRPQQRQRLHSDDSGTLPLKICACFAPPRAWMYAQRESTTKVVKRAVDSLFIMACHGNMIQYDLEPKPAAGVPKEKVCDDTMIELEVEAKGQWPLLRTPNSLEIVPPLPTSSPLLCVTTLPKDVQDVDTAEDRWLSQVEIVTHAGPHRRLWMGPQFVFKTYNATSGVAVNLAEAEAIEIGVTGGSRPARSNPVNMPHAAARSLVPVVIDGSGSSYEQSPRFMEAYGDSLDNETVGIGSGENQLREDLAEAMLETSIAPHRAPGRRSVFERVGQPVTKVVNPLGTVITVSADEEDVNSSQEFDSAEESHVPEAPRSVCAEEGPASLGDLEPESQTLRDLREICAEMRSASEPAINSVPDENIREVQEKKSLCAEIAPITNPCSTSIDFEKEEAFRDVPTSLSLCAEQGEIPSSPMTHAKETAWNRGVGKKEENVAHKGDLSEAQYVVNCDEDSVVLMEQTAHGQKKEECPRKSCDSEKSGKKSGKSSSGESGVGGRASESKGRARKYVLTEHEDSIVVEGALCADSRSGCGRKKACGASEKNLSAEGRLKSGEEAAVGESGKCKGKSKSSGAQEAHSRDARAKSGNAEGKSVEKCAVPISEVEEVGSTVETSADKTQDSGVAENTDTETTGVEQCKSQWYEPPMDDFSPTEYHIVESTCCSKDNALSNQSDEDIEHIQSSEITQMHQSECVDSEKCMDVTSYTDSPSLLQRKNSKNTISDDDLEYIHTSELADSSDARSIKRDSKFTDSEKASESDAALAAKSSRHVLSSDDDLEHVQHSDVCTSPAEAAATDGREKGAKKAQEPSADQGPKSKCARKLKDIVVIDSDTSAADVTVIVKPVDGWSRRTAEKKSSEDTEEPAAAKDTSAEVSPSPSRKAKGRSSKNAPAAAPKRSQEGAIEIIDIDAMQKAEMEVAADVSSVPECKILSGPLKFCPEGGAGTRTKKSRKNKKSHAESAAQIAALSEAALCVEPTRTEEEAALPDTQESRAPVEISWSSVVKKKGGSPSESEARKELDLKPFIDIEEEAEWMDAPRWKADEEFEKKGSSSRKNSSAENENVESEHLVESSSMFRSSVVIDELQEAVTEVDADENWQGATSSEAEPSWSSIVKKKTTSTGDAEDPKEPNLGVVEEVPEEVVSAKEKKNPGKSSKRDVAPDSPEGSAKRDTRPDDKGSPESVAESAEERVPLNLTTSEPPKEVSEAASGDDKNRSDEKHKSDDKGKSDDTKAVAVDATFSKEESSEPEPEKRSDSEQEVVPERSSSSDELNANVAFPSAEGDYAGREVAERSNANGATSGACSNAKKGNRSKKKKRR